MNNKGQMAVGGIIITAITVILGAIFLQAIAQSAGDSINTVAVANESLASVVNNTAQYLDYRALSSVVVYNATSDTLMDSSNYTVTNNFVNPTTGALSVRIVPHFASAAYVSAWEVSGTAQPTTYIAESGGRAMASLIIVMFALAVLAVVLAPVVKESMNFK